MKVKRFYNRPMGGWDRQEEIINPPINKIEYFLESLAETKPRNHCHDIYGGNSGKISKNPEFPIGKVMICVHHACGTMITNYVPNGIATSSTVILGELKGKTSIVKEKVKVFAVLNTVEYEKIKSGLMI